jgi:hypothetical protein
LSTPDDPPKLPFSRDERRLFHAVSRACGWLSAAHFVGAAALLFGGCCILPLGAALATNPFPGAQGPLGRVIGGLMVVGFLPLLLTWVAQGSVLVGLYRRFDRLGRPGGRDLLLLEESFVRLRLFFVVEAIFGLVALGLALFVGSVQGLASLGWLGGPG